MSLDRRMESHGKTVYIYAKVPRLSRWFGTQHWCKLLYANKGTVNGSLWDFTESKVYQSWVEEGGLFRGMKESHTIPLSVIYRWS